MKDFAKFPYRTGDEHADIPPQSPLLIPIQNGMDSEGERESTHKIGQMVFEHFSLNWQLHRFSELTFSCIDFNVLGDEGDKA